MTRLSPGSRARVDLPWECSTSTACPDGRFDSERKVSLFHKQADFACSTIGGELVRDQQDAALPYLALDRRVTAIGGQLGTHRELVPKRASGSQKLREKGLFSHEFSSGYAGPPLVAKAPFELEGREPHRPLNPPPSGGGTFVRVELK